MRKAVATKGDIRPGISSKEDKEDIKPYIGMGMDSGGTFDKQFPITQMASENGFEYRIYMLREFSDCCDYAEIIELLNYADHGDIVTFSLNSPGGYLHTLVMLLDAIKHCRAEVQVECAGTIASAATAFALACNALYVADHTEFMFHNYSGGIHGKGHEIQANAEFNKVHFDKFAYDVYKDFLSEDEIGRMLKGEDFYFGTEEVKERWDKVIAAREEGMKGQLQEAKNARMAVLVAEVMEAGFEVINPADKEADAQKKKDDAKVKRAKAAKDRRDAAKKLKDK